MPPWGGSQVRLAYDLPLEVMRQPLRSQSAGALRRRGSGLRGS